MKALLLILLLQIQFCFSQRILDQCGNFDWTKVEIETSHPERIEIMGIISQGTVLESYEARFAEMADAIHAIDLNNDGSRDFIYDGLPTVDGRAVAFFLNSGDRFELIFTVAGYFCDINLQEDGNKRILIAEPGCCSDPTTTLKSYDLYVQFGEPVFAEMSRIKIATNTISPERFINPAIPFETINDKYFLRSSPEIKDEPYDELQEKYGNQIGELPKGTRGMALAEKSDETGRVWWLVKIDPEYEILNNIFYRADDPSGRLPIMGWISSRYVKRL